MSRLIPASPAAIYAAFVDAKAVERWLPPGGMTARVIEWDVRKSGRYRIELTYKGDGKGKTSDRTDVSAGCFLELDPGRRIVWSAEFDSADPAFAGTMIMRWLLEPAGGGTQVTVTCENVPPGIAQVDHDAGMNSTLANLAGFVEGQAG